MEEFPQALRIVAHVDDDLGRTPAEIGLQALATAEPMRGEALGGDDQPWVVQLDPVLLAFPLTRTFLLAAAHTGLIDVVLPTETAEALHDLLFERAGLSLDQATHIVDLLVDLLDEHLHVRASSDAGLTSSGHAIARADAILARAADTAPQALTFAVVLTVDTFDELSTAQDLSDHIGPLGFAETAAAVAAVDV